MSGLEQIREALSAAGRDDKGFQVTASLPVVRDSNREMDLAQTMDAVPPMVEKGITDFRAALPIPPEKSAATDYLSGIVEAFRSAVGR